MIYESGKTNFLWNQSSKSVSFDGTYTTPPVINATIYDSSLDINVIIDNITTSGFTLMLSDNPGTTTTVNYIVFGE